MLQGSFCGTGVNKIDTETTKFYKVQPSRQTTVEHSSQARFQLFWPFSYSPKPRQLIRGSKPRFLRGEWNDWGRQDAAAWLHITLAA